jgi:putative transposase
MATHRPILTSGGIYHLFNRTINNENIFSSTQYISKFLEIVNYYRFYQTFRLSCFLKLLPQQQQEILDSRKNKEPLVEIYSYSFMPNHFHFLIKQLKDKGLSYFASNIQNSFAKYYNLINNRNGGLFQNSFNTKIIDSTEEFIHVSRYIHLNPVTSYIIDFEQLKKDIRTSFPCYINKKFNTFVSTDMILSHFKTPDRYISFVKNQINYQRTLKSIKNLLLD